MSEFEQKAAAEEGINPLSPGAMPKDSVPDMPTAAQTGGITHYLSAFEGEKFFKMKALRDLLNAYEPDMTEGISYGMPIFKFKGKNVFGFAPAKNHLGIYPGPEAIEAHQEELGGFVLTKGSIHLKWEEALPQRLIKSLLRFNISRVNEKIKPE